jgi:hypothetical protein
VGALSGIDDVLLADIRRNAILAAVLFRSGIHVFAEEGVEALAAVEAAVEGDFSDVDVGALQQEADDERIRAAEVVLCSVSKEAGEGQDLLFELSDDKRALIERVASLNENTVLIVSACNGFDMPWLPKVKAVLRCDFLGQERGAALTDVVSGAVNPTGRLPFSIEKVFKDSVDPEYNFIGGKPYWDGHHEYKSYWIRGGGRKIHRRT